MKVHQHIATTMSLIDARKWGARRATIDADVRFCCKHNPFKDGCTKHRRAYHNGFMTEVHRLKKSSRDIILNPVNAFMNQVCLDDAFDDLQLDALRKAVIALVIALEK